jgi:flagellar biosynthetic protein FliR
MSFLQTLLINQFLIFTLVLARISGLVMTAPIYGSQSVPMRIRGLLAVAIALLVTPAYLGTPIEYPGSAPNYLVYLGGELLIGLTMGLGILILFGGVQVAGQIISQLGGMSLADVFDPNFGGSSPVFAQILFYVAMAVFVLIDGHRVVMGAMLDTFEAVPPGSGILAASVVDSLTTILTMSFTVGIRAAAPIMIAMLLSTFVLGLISRTLPQLNIIAVGFGLNAMIVQSALFFSLGAIAWTFQEEVIPVLDLIQQSLTGEYASLHPE